MKASNILKVAVLALPLVLSSCGSKKKLVEEKEKPVAQVSSENKQLIEKINDNAQGTKFVSSKVKFSVEVGNQNITLTGNLRMMRDDCTDAAAVNDIEQRFFVRLPALYADLFDAECIETAGETARLFTKPVAVDAMHALVKSIREKGAEVFFASVEEEND